MAPGLDALADWRHLLERDLSQLENYLFDNGLLSEPAAATSRALRQRLASDKLVVAFVAEFSRGKSELINAIFFADLGRRVLPATAGRTTMCPLELTWNPAEQPCMDLLPIQSRKRSTALSEWRQRRDSWTRVPLEPDNADGLAKALLAVTETIRVSRAEAASLGLWNDDAGADNPPVVDGGQVEIPAWRHAIINYPHPLLQRGLVVVDTPGLNAIGTEPELTLGLLPSAHAALFVLGADTGVTRSDLDIWSAHLGDQGLASFVVLNKVDVLADPLATPEEIERTIEKQCSETAATLGMPRDRVFPLSARQALVARMNGDTQGLEASRLPVLETALAHKLLPQRQGVLARAVVGGVQAIHEEATRRMRDIRRQNAEQMLELRGLRGKSAPRVRQMAERVARDSAEFERCASRLSALRSVHARMLHSALQALDLGRVREAVDQLQKRLGASWFNLRAGAAFAEMCDVLRGHVGAAEKQCDEIEQMLKALFDQLNTEFGFSLAITEKPDWQSARDELDLLQRSYSKYFSVTRAIKLNDEKFSEQFRRMLTAKIRVTFEVAANAIEAWNQTVSAQIDTQFRERRRGFRRRRESLERIQLAAGELDGKLQEVEVQDARVLEQIDHAQKLVTAVRQRAERGPLDSSGAADAPLLSAGQA